MVKYVPSVAGLCIFSYLIRSWIEMPWKLQCRPALAFIMHSSQRKKSSNNKSSCEGFHEGPGMLAGHLASFLVSQALG